MNSKIDFINGQTSKSLAKMFLPLMAAMTLMMIYNMVDSLWVGNLLGERGMSALTAGTAIVLIMNSLAMGVGNGISVMISRLVGAKDKEHLAKAIATVLAVSGIMSIILFIIGELSVVPVLNIMGIHEEIFEEAALYLKIYLAGNAALFMYMQFTSVFRAFGDPTFQLKGMLLTSIFNAVADPFFIKLWGLAGAAAVTVAAEVLCLVYAIFYYRKRKMFSIDFGKTNGSDAKEMLRLCAPTTIQAIMPPISSAVMVSFVTSFGLTAMAGFGVARNLELIMFMPTSGMCMAVTTIVGQCVGAGRHDRAKDYLVASMKIGGCMIAVLSGLVIVFAPQLTGVFGQGAETAEVVAAFFKLLSIGYVLYMLTSCMQGYITGSGKPEKAMILLVLYYIVFRIPAAAFLKGACGLKGIWLAFLVSHILALITAIIMTARSQRKETIHDNTVF